MSLTSTSFPPLKNDLFIRACKGEEVERVPVWIMRQAGRYLPEFKEVRAESDFFRVCRNPELACKVTLQPIDRFPLDAAIIFSDILVVPQAMGFDVEMIPGKGPHFNQPLQNPSELSRVEFPVNVSDKLQYVFDAITLTRHKLEGRVPLIGFSGAPWTLMTYCIEGGGISGSNLTKSKTWLYKHPQESHQLLSMLTRVCIDYLLGQIKAGAQALQVFDSWASDLSPAIFKEFCLPYLAQIADEIKQQYPDFPLICFAKGANFSLTELSKTKYDVLGVDWTIEPSKAREFVGDRVTLQGNLDPVVLYGGEEVIKSEVEKMIKSFGTRRYIANLGHGMQPQHTVESAANFVKFVQEISRDLIKQEKQ
eukprot:gene10249-12569_t